MEKINIAVVVGTKRLKRMSIHAARFVEDVGRSIPEVEIKFVDPNDYNLPDDGNDEDVTDPKYTEITAWADAFFIVSPEYNHSFPGSLKRMLDSEFDNYRHKAVAIAGVSDGPFGGARMIESLVNVLRDMALTISRVDVHFPNVDELFDENGKMTKDEEKNTERVRKSYMELIWLASAMKAARLSED